MKTLRHVALISYLLLVSHRSHGCADSVSFRPTMIKYGINNIRELVGHKVNLQMVYDSPVCRLDS